MSTYVAIMKYNNNNNNSSHLYKERHTKTNKLNRHPQYNIMQTHTYKKCNVYTISYVNKFIYLYK